MLLLFAALPSQPFAAVASAPTLAQHHIDDFRVKIVHELLQKRLE